MQNFQFNFQIFCIFFYKISFSTSVNSLKSKLMGRIHEYMNKGISTVFQIVSTNFINSYLKDETCSCFDVWKSYKYCC